MKEVFNIPNIRRIDSDKETFGMPFPNNGKMNPDLVKFGFKREDILEIREILVKEIKRQNEEEKR